MHRRRRQVGLRLRRRVRTGVAGRPGKRCHARTTRRGRRRARM